MVSKLLQVLMRQSNFLLQTFYAYRANQWVEEAGAHTGTDVADRHNKAGGHAFLFSIVRK